MINKHLLLGVMGLFTNTLLAQVHITCDDVEVAKDPLMEVSYLEAIEQRVDDTIEACELGLRSDQLVATHIHPFVEAVHYAYAQHRPLTISPDMIWLLICQGFSKHIDYNSEVLKDKFVDFEGKKQLQIDTEHLSLAFHKGSVETPWKLVFPIFADSIGKYVGTELQNLFVQSFTTTTFMEKVAFEITLMDGMDSYFEYSISTACGIPSIRVEGTPEDWQQIQLNLQQFKGYEIDNWILGLEPIIEEFVQASRNNINHDFWTNIYKRFNESGGPFIRGWLIKFFPYLKTIGEEPMMNPYIDKEPIGVFSGLTTTSFYSGLSKADFLWKYYGKEYEMEFLAGFIGIRQDPKTMNLKPEIGWVVKDKKKEE